MLIEIERTLAGELVHAVILSWPGAPLARWHHWVQKTVSFGSLSRSCSSPAVVKPGHSSQPPECSHKSAVKTDGRSSSANWMCSMKGLLRTAVGPQPRRQALKHEWFVH